MAELNAEKENRMGTASVHGLLLRISAPLMVSMFIQSLYNIVDSMFVSRVSEDALTAVSMCFPIQMLIISVGVGVGVGMSALLSRFLGAKQYEHVNSIARNGIFLSICSAIIFIIVAFFAGDFMSLQTKDARIITYGVQYLEIISRFSIMVFLQITMERLLQGTGKTLYVLFVQGTGAIVNIILDPILIFGLFGMPRLEVKGAAIATIIGQTCGMLLGIVINIMVNKEVSIDMRGFRPSLTDIKHIYAIALPSMVLQSVGAAMMFCMNIILASFSTTSVAVFGAFFRLQSFIFMPVFGLNNGIVPIVAYNYGAKYKKRLEEAMRLGTRYGVLIMTIGCILFQIFPVQLLEIFDASDKMLELGTITLRIISLGFPLAGYAIMRGSIFQALGKSVYSMNISLVRQLGILLPAVYLLSRLGNVNLIWLAFPLAEVVGFSMSIRYFGKIKREILDPL